MRINAINPNLPHSSIKAKSSNRRVVEPIVSAPITFNGKVKTVYSSLGAIAGAIAGFALGGLPGAIIGGGLCSSIAHEDAEDHERSTPEEHESWADYAEDHAMHDRD